MPSYFWPILYTLYYLTALFAIQRLLLARREPRQTMIWILTLLLLPFLGLIWYLVVGPVPLQRRVRRRVSRRRLIAEALENRSKVLAQSHGVRDIPTIDPGQRALMRMASYVSETIPTSGNDVHIFTGGESVFIAMRAMIEAARHHVHLEFYIFADDETGRGVCDLLAKKAAEGVGVRILVDAVGSWKLSRRFVNSLRARGIKFAYFLPWGLTGRRIHLSCRNHRKLIVVDGQEGIVGSGNIADEYRGRKGKLGPWRDTTMKISGPAVTQLQEVFVEDWHFATQEKLTGDEYFPQAAVAGDKIVQIVPSGPDRKPGIMDQLLFAAVADARESVLIITPYFVPDSTMLVVLQAAAYRGVRVRLLMPSRSDNWIVLWAGRSSYPEMLEAGVEVYEYDKGMLHSKVVVIDHRWGMLGSANMDVRSFRINFEITNLLYNAELAEFLQKDFETLLTASHRITPGDLKGWNYGQRLAVGVIRLAAPLL
jgi:cardiolipin synthase